ncbi:arginine repressor, partial [Staphylococcus epidermidis]
MLPKNSLTHIKITHIISNQQIQTQHQLLKPFNHYHLNLTQPTLSPHIKQFQLIKLPPPTPQYLYTLPNHPTYHPLHNFATYLIHSFLNIHPTHDLLL